MIAYLMRMNKQNYDHNFTVLKEISAKVDPNIGFISQLKEYHRKLTEPKE